MALKSDNVNPSLSELSRVESDLQFEDIIITTNATPDTEDSFSHNLGSIPKGYSVINQDKAGSIYEEGTTAWSDSAITLAGSVASITATLRIWK